MGRTTKMDITIIFVTNMIFWYLKIKDKNTTIHLLRHYNPAIQYALASTQAHQPKQIYLPECVKGENNRSRFFYNA